MCVENCTTLHCKSGVRPGRFTARASTTLSRRTNSQTSRPFERTFVRFTVKFCKMCCASQSTTSSSTSREVFQALEESGSPGCQDSPQSVQPTQRFSSQAVARDRQQLWSDFCRRPERKRSIPWDACEIGTRCRMGGILSKTFVQGCECRTKVRARRSSWDQPALPVWSTKHQTAFGS